MTTLSDNHRGNCDVGVTKKRCFLTEKCEIKRQKNKENDLSLFSDKESVSVPKIFKDNPIMRFHMKYVYCIVDNKCP